MTDEPTTDTTDLTDYTETNSESDNEEIDGYREVEMSQFTAVTGFPSDYGYRFPVTQPLRLVGVTVDDLRSGTDAMLYLADPDAEQSLLTAALVVGEDLPTGHKNDRYRTIQNSGTSLVVYLKAEELQAMGIDVDEVTPDTDPTQIESLPVLDVWAGPDGMAFRQLDIREVVVNKELDHAVEALPKQMAADYRAITEEGYTYGELAEEYAKEMETPVYIIEWKIRRNVEEAEERIEEYNATHQD